MIAKNPSIKTNSNKNSAGEIINPTKKDVANYNKKYETVRMSSDQKVFHQAAGIAQSSGKMSPGYKAPTPFKVVGNAVKSTIKTIGKGISKTAQAITAPEVNRLKIQDAKMKKMDREAKSGMYNR